MPYSIPKVLNKEILISKYLGQIYCWSKGPILTLDNFEDLIYYLYITEHTRECVFFWDLLLFYVNMVVRFQDLYKIRWLVLKLLRHFGQANFINKFFTRYSSNDLGMTSTLEFFTLFQFQKCTLFANVLWHENSKLVCIYLAR